MAQNENSLGTVLPFLAVFVGLALSIWRFRVDDAVGGLAGCLGGVLAMIALACLLDRGTPAASPRAASDVEVAPRERAHARQQE